MDAGLEELIGQIQDLMWNEVGIVRMRTGMQKAVKALEEMAPKLGASEDAPRYEAANLHLAALLVAQFRLGARGKPRRPLSHGLSRSRRQEVPEALRRSRQREGCCSLVSSEPSFRVSRLLRHGNAIESAIEIKQKSPRHRRQRDVNWDFESNREQHLHSHQNQHNASP